jgi:hypothetical protein
MATGPQSGYLRTLGVDLRVDLDGVSKEESSQWITELKAYHEAAGLPPNWPVSVADLRRLRARGDALVLPPARTLASAQAAGPVGGPAERMAALIPPPDDQGGGRRLSGRSDEGWWRLEVSRTLQTDEGQSITVTVGGSEHFRRPLEPDDVEDFGKRVRGCLELQVERLRAMGSGAAGVGA